MIKLGYWLSREEHAPNDLVRYAQRAEAAGFTFALISDYIHPWLDHPGHCPFMWNVIGGIAYATKQLRLGTIVTRSAKGLHPAAIVEAAATAGAMMPGRFFLGVGVGDPPLPPTTTHHWTRDEMRRDMLAEVVEVIRLSWNGGPAGSIEAGHQPYRGADVHFYRLPKELPPLFVAANGKKSAELAGRLGDGLIAVEPVPDLVRSFERAGGLGKPRYGKLNLCWARDEAEARFTAQAIWPTAHLKGQSFKVVCGPDPDECLSEIRRFAEAGFDHLSLHQLGPDQEGFFQFYEQELFPAMQDVARFKQFA